MKIVTAPNPILRTICEPYKTIADEDTRLALDMVKWINDNNHKGAGLAAPQIGINKRLIVIDYLKLNCRHPIFFNPEIVSEISPVHIWEEECFSLPNKKFQVARRTHIKVKALDCFGTKFYVNAYGYLSFVLQHEIDHLNGVLIADREETKHEQRK